MITTTNSRKSESESYRSAMSMRGSDDIRGSPPLTELESPNGSFAESVLYAGLCHRESMGVEHFHLVTKLTRRRIRSL